MMIQSMGFSTLMSAPYDTVVRSGPILHQRGRRRKAFYSSGKDLFLCDGVVLQRGAVMARPRARPPLPRQRPLAPSLGRGVPVAPGAQGLASCHPAMLL